ncbi:MAG: DNA polymerase III subunit chi [Rubricella sp.]
MGEVRFYRLAGEGEEGILPILLERVLGRGQRAVVRGQGQEVLERIDRHLWSYRQDSFLPHARAGGPHDADQPILLTQGREAPNGAQVLLLVDGARVDTSEAERFEMIVRLFGHEGIETAREDWRAVTDAGLEAVFWAQENGKWMEKARSGG